MTEHSIWITVPLGILIGWYLERTKHYYAKENTKQIEIWTGAGAICLIFIGMRAPFPTGYLGDILTFLYVLMSGVVAASMTSMLTHYLTPKKEEPEPVLVQEQEPEPEPEKPNTHGIIEDILKSNKDETRR
jgi:hypothetical protein